jgi:hypothetical protein
MQFLRLGRSSDLAQDDRDFGRAKRVPEIEKF